MSEMGRKWMLAWIVLNKAVYECNQPYEDDM